MLTAFFCYRFFFFFFYSQSAINSVYLIPEDVINDYFLQVWRVTLSVYTGLIVAHQFLTYVYLGVHANRDSRL